VNNSPINFVDPTGLEPHGMTTEEADKKGWADPSDNQDRGHRLYYNGNTGESKSYNIKDLKAEVRKFYNYDEKYKLTEDETLNFHELMDRRIALEKRLAELDGLTDGWARSEKNRLTREYYHFFMSIIAKQTNIDLDPLGDMACNYMTILASIQLITNTPMPVSMINSLTAELSKHNDSGHTKLTGMEALTAEYGTQYWWDIADEALGIIGFNDFSAKFIENDSIGSFTQLYGKTKKNGEYWIALIHINNIGSFIWDPQAYPGISIKNVNFAKSRPDPLFINRR